MQVLQMLAPMRSPFVEQLFGMITRFGEETVAILVICTLFWCVNKRLGYGIGVSFFLSGLLVQGLKIGFRVERPWVRDPSFQPATSAILHATGYSFPSGHTQAATSIFVSFGLGVRRHALRILLFAIPVLVAISRLVLGVHTPQDVLVSLVLSTIVSLLVMRVMLRPDPRSADCATAEKGFGKEGLVSVTVACISVGLMVFAAMLHRNGIMDAQYLADSYKIAGSGIGFALGHFLERRFICFTVKTRKPWMQLLKVVLGIGGLLALQQGFKLVLGPNAEANAIRYCLMILWALAAWPLFFKRFFAPPSMGWAEESGIKPLTRSE